MLPRWLTALFVLSREVFSARRDARFRFLKLQVKILQSRLPGNRIIPDPGGIVFRPSRPLPFRHNVGDWGCTSISSITTLSQMILNGLWKPCWVACSSELFWSWTAGRFIVPQPSALGHDLLGVCRSNGCQRTPRNLIQTNRYGLAPSMWIWRTTFRLTLTSWVGPSGVRSGGHVVNSSCYGPSSNMQNSNCRQFSYPFKSQ